MKQVGLLTGVISAWVVCLPLRVAAQSGPSLCDAVLLTVASGRFPYGPRPGGYCEGTYTRPVSVTWQPRFEGAASGGLLEVVSVVARFEPFPTLGRTDTLTIAWQDGGTGPVTIRARTFEHRVHYQLDAVAPADSRRFRWPTRVLAAEQVPWDRLGLNVWGIREIGGTAVPVHLPVTASRRDSVQAEYALVILPSTSLTALSVSVALAAPEANGMRESHDLRPEGNPPFFAGRPVRVPFRGIREPGIYHVEISAFGRGEQPDAEELWVFIPGST